MGARSFRRGKRPCVILGAVLVIAWVVLRNTGSVQVDVKRTVMVENLRNFSENPVLSVSEKTDEVLLLTPSHALPTTTTTTITTQARQSVLDIASIKITPKNPTVVEGHAVQLSCMSLDRLRGNSTATPYMTFELPPMSPGDARRIQLMLRPGVAIVKIARVRRAHQGVYKCVKMNITSKVVRFNSITLHVIPRDIPEVEEEEVMDDDVANEENMEEEMPPEKLAEFMKKWNQQPVQPVDIQQLLARGKSQEKQVEMFCGKYNMSSLAGALEEETPHAHTALYRHLLINDKSQTIFCFVPKTGCTNLRLLFFIVQGYVPLSELLQPRDAVDQEHLEYAQFQESFLNRNFHQRQYSLSHYFKFMMYRNPLERLASGYRSKVARHPLMGLDNDDPHYNWLRKFILAYTHPEQYSEFIKQEGKHPVNISFPDFIKYWLDQPQELQIDEHFCSTFSIAQPCRIRYNFYANFKHFDSDVHMLTHRINANPQYLRQGYYEKDSLATEVLAPSLFDQLDLQQKHGVLQVLALDLDFYYHIFPEEKDIHKQILNLNVDLPTILQVHQYFQ